ncbi:MAG: hypothetical protein HQP61_04440 [Peptococcaceae bacterium]|nr:hypothetical protein [Peptococcaceae bacterium]NQS75683.1 hypothetical protein [Candidatus Syntrophopropionicum ammoniitolerans]
MAKCLVLKAEDICDNNGCVQSRLISYYKHYALFNENFFRETEPQTAAVSLDACRDLAVFPGIYELVFAGKEGEQQELVTIKFVKPVDMWEIEEAGDGTVTKGCSCSHE